ncbi:response regulator [Pseudobacillus badius]|uniref:response regulator n=1 Tax=Bacillus badius TaxID=1455 RepID=UPI0007B06958|nr:response regulator transcription factor [Bacillus badius]KZO00055.1 DNA-binding response regulator [Bacillus badius]MED0665528.1 response regulator transcription factor [Bacillus badius]OCS86216.1 DNA-binding response regulator [Bacillus badius]OVE52322.1 DNA-binding response regulator [Bacillus badius]TDW04049.1 LuxR family two component transcriptional regulator [Bacillus badius]
MKVMVVDDHDLIRKGIILLLESYADIEVAADAGDGNEALVLAMQTEPDVVLMDISMPNGLDGFTTTKQLIQQQPNIKVVLLTMHDEEAYIRQAIQSGAHGYILKKSQGSELYEAIYHVYHGQRYYRTDLSEEQIEKMMKEKEKPVSPLTLREQEVLRLTVLGYTNKEIAEKLHISAKTVENHKSNIMNKLDIKQKHEMIQYGIKNYFSDMR